MTPEILKSLLHYDPVTGIFTWVKDVSNSVKAGARAGTRKGRYEHIRYKGKCYQAHRLAWLYMTGSMPDISMQVDHKDGNELNNRWENLRLATHGQNQANKKGFKKSTSRWKGVSWNTNAKQWVAQIKSQGNLYKLGYFRDERDAAEAYIFKALELHGEYARFE